MAHTPDEINAKVNVQVHLDKVGLALPGEVYDALMDIFCEEAGAKVEAMQRRAETAERNERVAVEQQGRTERYGSNLAKALRETENSLSTCRNDLADWKAAAQDWRARCERLESRIPDTTYEVTIEPGSTLLVIAKQAGG